MTEPNWATGGRAAPRQPESGVGRATIIALTLALLGAAGIIAGDVATQPLPYWGGWALCLASAAVPLVVRWTRRTR